MTPLGPVIWLALVPPTLAHRSGLSYAEISPGQISLTFAKVELASRLPIDEGDLGASRDLAAQLTLDQVQVRVDGRPCTVGAPALSVVSTSADAATDGIELRAPLDCPEGQEYSYTAGFFPSLEPGHRHYLGAQGEPVAVLDAGTTTATFRLGAIGRGGQGVGRQFFSLGVEHIWTGYDHLLFLLGLLLAAGSLRAMLFIVTGFTVAHSITLSLAALGIVSLPSSVVEPAIALTIAFVGVENLWRPPTRRRVLITFLLGFIHGFGFAGQLRELGLPSDALLLALVAFNGGVELGQAAVVAVTLPLLLLCRRLPWWDRIAVPVGSIAVALAGLLWFLDRTVGL